MPEVYAKEAIFLHDEPRRELKLQAIRIGELGITAIPERSIRHHGTEAQGSKSLGRDDEYRAGERLRRVHPASRTARDGRLYNLAGAHRRAGGSGRAQDCRDSMLALLEKVAGKTRRPLLVPDGTYAEAVLASRPLAYWRLDDIEGPFAHDSSPNAHLATYDGGVAFFLPGATAAGLTAASWINRSVHFAGGRLKTGLTNVGTTYSVELWFWNGLPKQLRPISGYLVALDVQSGDQLGIGGTQVAPGRLFFATDNIPNKALAGITEIAPRTWHHLAVVREDSRVTIYLDGNREPEISGEVMREDVKKPTPLLIGGQRDGSAGFEGKIDEIAVYDRALTADEFAIHDRAVNAP